MKIYLVYSSCSRKVGEDDPKGFGGGSVLD